MLNLKTNKMKSIPGIEKLTAILTTEQLEKLDRSAQRHIEMSNMSFKILSATERNLEIEVVQNETKSGRYATEATLTSRTKELFGKFLPDTELNISAVAYSPSPASVVTTAWLEQKMQQKGVRIKQIAFQTGIDKQAISDWVTGKKSMSQLVKAMFYFYLSS